MGKKSLLLKRQNNEDKDLQNHHVSFAKLRETVQNLMRCVQDLVTGREGDLKSLASFEISSIDLGSPIPSLELSSFSSVRRAVRRGAEPLYRSKGQNPAEILVGAGIPDPRPAESPQRLAFPSNSFKVWIRDCSDVIAALKRREVLDEEVFEDLQRIEETRRNNLKTNNRRDIEMDLLQTRLDSNQRLLAKTTKTLLLEIAEFKRKSEKELVQILRTLDETCGRFFRDGGVVY